jgi:hypothetical protein
VIYRRAGLAAPRSVRGYRAGVVGSPAEGMRFAGGSTQEADLASRERFVDRLLERAVALPRRVRPLSCSLLKRDRRPRQRSKSGKSNPRSKEECGGPHATDLSPRVSEPIQADRASFSTGTQGLRMGHIEETDAQEDWLSLATADPAF